MSARASSSYYPPRAGWGRHFNHLGHTVRRRLHLEQLGLVLKTSPSNFALGLVVPGFGFLDAGWKTLGKATMLAWMVAALVFLVWLGYGVSTFAFGLMMSMHVSSILYLHNRTFPGMRILRRLVFSLALLFVVGQLVYASALKLCHNYLVHAPARRARRFTSSIVWRDRKACAVAILLRAMPKPRLLATSAFAVGISGQDPRRPARPHEIHPGRLHRKRRPIPEPGLYARVGDDRAPFTDMVYLAFTGNSGKCKRGSECCERRRPADGNDPSRTGNREAIQVVVLEKTASHEPFWKS
jgi:hypothetical protein